MAFPPPPAFPLPSFVGFFCPNSFPSQTLPQRVSELFQMYDFGSDSAAPFFSSPFLRDKMPSLLFSDRMNGLSERRESEQSQKGAAGGGGVVRHIPIKILGDEAISRGEEQKKSKREGFHTEAPTTDKEEAFGMRPPPSTTASSSSASPNFLREDQNYQNSSSHHLHDFQRFRPAALPHNSPELRRHFASLFWTPQQARRISDREQQKWREEENGTPLSADGADATRKLSLGERLSTSTPPPLSRAGAGSTITVYTIPIASPSSPSPAAETLTKTKPMDNGGWKQRDDLRTMSPEPYSAIPFKRSSGKALLSNATSTPSLFLRNLPQARRVNGSPISEKPAHPSPAPKGAAPFPTFRSIHSPPSSSSTQNAHPFPHGHSTAASSLPPPLRRTHTTLVLPPDHQQQQMLFRRDSEPMIAVLNNTGKIGEVEGMGKEQNERRTANGRAGEGPVPTAAASRSPLAGESEDRSSLSGSVSCSSSSSATQTRSKSPSLSSIRQSLLRFRPAKKGAVGGAVSPVGSSSSSGSSSLLTMPSCVRFRHSSGSEAEEESEAERTRDHPRVTAGSSKSADGTKNSRVGRVASPAANSRNLQSPVITSSLRLTEFVPSDGETQRKKVPRAKQEEVDAVEEAIRSLEQFDPSEFVSQQYKTEQTAKANGRTTEQQKQQRNQQQNGTSPFIRTRVFLARAEPVQLHPTGSANSLPSPLPERRLSLSFSAADQPFTASSADQLLFSSCHPSFLPAVPSLPSALSSSGSATPTFGSLASSQQLLPSLVEPAFSQSMDSINRTPRANSPSSAAFSASQQPPQTQNGVRRAVTFNDNTVQHFYTPFDGPPPDYSDSDGDDAMGDGGGGGSLADSEEGDDTANSAAVEAEAQLRKRFFCSQLTDCAKVVDTNALKMSQFVAAGIGHGGWRQSHILRHNLAAIRDIVYTVEFALGELVESLGRISLDMRDVHQQSQLRQLTRPVKTTLAMLKRVRHSLDSTGWSLSALSRSAGTYAGQDALDQFVAMLPQLPKDCYKLVQWVYSLSVWRESPCGGATSVFLPPSTAGVPFHAKTHPPPPPPAPLPQRPSSPSSSLLNYYSSESIEDEQNNNSNNEDSFGNWANLPTNGTSTDRHGEQGKGGRAFVGQQQWHPQNGGAMANDVMDGGESTSSTSSVLTAEERAGGGGEGGGGSSADEIRRNSPDKGQSLPVGGRQKVADLDGDVVMEEDDLQSVLSEATGNDAQTRLAEFLSSGGVSMPSSPDHSHQRRVNAELARSLAPDQKDLFRLYESQIDSHMSAFSRNIEEFFSMIESQTEPKLSFQKVQMIFIEGHSLVGIVRVITRDDAIIRHRPLGAFLEHESARIDALLNECLATAKVAKAKAHTVPAIQAVCSAVVSVSERAHQLKAFWKLCSVGA